MDKKILLCGIPSESPILLVKKALIKKGAHVIIFNQRLFDTHDLRLEVTRQGIQGEFFTNDSSYQLSDIQSIYPRIMNFHDLPEYKNRPSANQIHCKKLHDSINQYMELTDVKVVNKHSQMFSNSSKPYQAQIVRKHGLKTPKTLITNNPKEVLDFKKQFKSIIYKSISGVRSIVKEFDPSDKERLDKIRYCPVQFQERVSGFDVRVHVIKDKTIATKISTTGVDYRYAVKEGGDTRLEPFKINKKIQKACIQLSAALNLDFSGIDLRISENGDVYCFEINPMPGYSYYENHTGQKISEVLADYLISDKKFC